MDEFNIGDDVFVRGPQELYDDCTCIVGVIDEIIEGPAGALYAFNAEVCRRYPLKPSRHRVAVPAAKLGHRIGTPLSELSLGNGRTTERFREIGRSWGYP